MSPDAAEREAALAKRLEQCYTGAVHDVIRAMGQAVRVLPHEINPLDPTRRLAGPVFTISGGYEEGQDPHQTLLAWTEMLTVAPAGSVIVCEPHDDRVAHMGELSAETLQFRGVRGYVVNGGCRDVEFILGIGFPVFCRYTTPVDVVGCWVPFRFGEPIQINSTPVKTGDWLVADRDGIVVFSGDQVKEVVAESERVMRTESKVRRAILEGMDPKGAYLKYGKF
jgi:regulator of RNase E activity RraA